jgi:UDP-N-acetylmuramyl pentapeptide phosphotransferase/UDP-N-acetylglucosamine-1-phosphate transferase
MPLIGWLAIGIVAAFAISLVLCQVLIAVGFRDEPKEARKAEVHTKPVTTGGGLAVAVATVIVALGVIYFARIPLSPIVTVTAAASLAAMVLGLCDDKLELDAVLKLAIILGVCGGMTILGVRVDVLAPWPGAFFGMYAWMGAIGSVLWLVVVINAVNFMDGANGLAMGMAAIAAAGLAACGFAAFFLDVGLLAAILFGALCGFLVLNVAGKLFVGDAGALFAGTMLAGLSLVLVKMRPDWLLVPPTILLPFLSDVLITLAWRWKHGKKLFKAHRDHTYQIAMKAGLKHWQVAAIHAVWALNAAGLGVIGAIAGGWAPLMVFVVLLLVSVWLHLWVRREGVKNGLVGANIA